MWFKYEQSNPGGSFADKYMRILVEADTWQKADDIVQYKYGVYFDNCSADSRFGDRWYSAQWSNANTEPKPFSWSETIATPSSIKEDFIAGIPKGGSIHYMMRDKEITITRWADGTELELAITSEDANKAAERKRDEGKSIWAVSWGLNWNRESYMFQAYESDYDENQFWDEEGNRSASLGWDEDLALEGFFTYGDTDKAKVEQVRDKMKEAETVVSEARSKVFDIICEVMQENA